MPSAPTEIDDGVDHKIPSVPASAPSASAPQFRRRRHNLTSKCATVTNNLKAQSAPTLSDENVDDIRTSSPTHVSHNDVIMVTAPVQVDEKIDCRLPSAPVRAPSLPAPRFRRSAHDSARHAKLSGFDHMGSATAATPAREAKLVVPASVADNCSHSGAQCS